MSANEEWNVEKHKQEHECDEHWELRKSFLEAHKDRFPEEHLVCLAQVFTNVELLGCRYPKETMDLVAELSKEVAHDYRERQKSRLQRTFVKASDAASSKAKGSTSSPPAKRQNLAYQRPTYSKIFARGFVIMRHPNTSAPLIIENSARMNGYKIEWRTSTTPSQSRIKPSKRGPIVCEVFVNDEFLDYSHGSVKKDSKTNAARKILCRLSRMYYTIGVKEDWKSSLLVKQVSLKTEAEPVDELFDSKNIGVKLMKSMGWTGGGLGKSQQGVFEPVTLQRHRSRSGVGMTLNTGNTAEFKNKCHEALVKFIREGKMHDHLSFSDLTNEERAIMHQCASKLGLKSESYGPKGGQRILLISLKIQPMTLLKQLLADGSSEKYVLMKPHKISSLSDLSYETESD